MFFTYDVINCDVHFNSLFTYDVINHDVHEADMGYSIQSTWLCYRLVRFLITAHIC